jgi:hypothetical protein
VRAALAEARQGLRLPLRLRRRLLSAIGIASASAMQAAALAVRDGLGRGFDRAARAADLPEVIVHYESQPIDKVAARISALPDLAAFSTRLEVTDVGIGSGNHERGDAVAEVVPGSGRADTQWSRA